MFAKKEKSKRQTRPAGSLAQYGIFEVPETLDDIGNDFMNDDGDDDLESELAALTASDNNGQKTRRKAPRKPVPKENLDTMIAESDDDSSEEVSPEKEENLVAESTEEPEPQKDNTPVESTVKSSPEAEVTEQTISTVDVGTTLPEEPTSVKTIDEEALKLLKNRQQEYKVAAVAWKKAGNKQEALQCVNIAKQFDIVIAAVNAGEAIDLSDMPPSPNTPGLNTATQQTENSEKIENEIQSQAPAEVKPTGPVNLDTALKERLEICRRIKVTAESEGNSSKARRYGRICKQFEDAIKLHARGKPIALDELPIPPGCEPLTATTISNVPAPTIEQNEKQPEPTPQTVPEPEPSENKASPTPKKPVSPPTQIEKKQNQKISRVEKQRALLVQRQHELKQAALNAKKDGDIELARNYLRQAKGIDPLIEASQFGLPVDMSSIPLSPRVKNELSAASIAGLSDDSFTVVNTEDCLEEATGTDEEIYENLVLQLTKQIKWCLCTRDHSKALGDVPGYNRWERLALNYKRDLDMLRVRKRDALPPPQHHYENKTYSIVQSCTDLSDSDLEISIIRGVNYPKDADTYVIYEFPYPSDSPPTDRTSTVKGTCNPEYEAVFPLTIDRSSRPCQRAFKRHALKCQVWSKG
ncbi:Coiled-coil and C2 domain-containing protein 1-like [Habropoda laboriosa]|uniref:Coiled-coil and C2 domain-containing protein 1-like n=1 Tax=Habropoda laboriosa TaxID=597456 RepID=A0A0L7RFV9_9HYME|nr:Coiled-coil and C2 domain-containing protein 1-like [Habropoda laboriosa]